GRRCGRSGRRLLRALPHASTDALPRVLVASFGSARPASRSASPDRWIRASTPRTGPAARTYHIGVIGINVLDVMVRLFVALLLGGLIGLERERQERAAGLRTVTMVSLGSCLFTLLSLGAFHATNTDPSRVAAQIVTGIGFLGAGTIFLRKDLVRGLTTAATIWATAAIGMATATGEFFAAAFTTLLILAVL